MKAGSAYVIQIYHSAVSLLDDKQNRNRWLKDSTELMPCDAQVCYIVTRRILQLNIDLRSRTYRFEVFDSHPLPTNII